ncbi:hypothetical protein ACHAPT_009295 [Fusarium lateritium]
MLVLKQPQGVPLKKAWPDLSEEDRDRIAKQAADCLGQLRKLQSPKLQSLGEKPLFSKLLFQYSPDYPHGPYSADNYLWGAMGDPDTILKSEPRIPPATPYTFTHGDLNVRHFLVKDGNLSGITNWEASGYFPVWWEYVATRVSEGIYDKEWKTLLVKYMDNHPIAADVWGRYYVRSRAYDTW